MDGSYGLCTTNQSGNEVYVPVAKVEVDLLEESSWKDLNLPDEIQTNLNNRAQTALRTGARYVTLFVPDDGTHVPKETRSSDVSTLSSTSEWVYTTYNGVSMKSYLLYAYSLNSNNIEYNNEQAKTVAEAMVSLTLTSASMASKTISYVTTGLSILDDLCQASGISASVLSGGSGDYIQQKFRYDIVEKFTYAKIGELWRYGLYTQQVKVKYTYVEAYLYSAENRQGYEESWENYSVTIQKTANFSNPDAKAYACATTSTYAMEYTYWQAYTGGKRYKFDSGQ